MATRSAAYLFVLLPASVGAVLAAMAYVGPETGVEDTVGALLALIGAAAVAAGSLLAMVAGLLGWLRGTLDALLFVAAALTALAAWFLMLWAVVIAMALAAAGVLAALPFRRSRRAA